MMTRPWRLAIWVVVGAVLLLAGFAAVLASWAWKTIHEPYQAYSKNELLLEVPLGTDARRILEQLEQEGVLANATLARFYLVHRLGDPSLKAGEYRFRDPISTPEVLARLIRGEVVTYPVTIIEGLTLEETARHLDEAGFGEQERFETIMRSPRLIADLDPEATDLEGYLFPETYQFARGTSEEDIVEAIMATFRERLKEAVPALRDPDFSLHRMVTLASIVEKEARLDDERPLIAGVYANRLRRGMPLQADPTVIYALKIEGSYDGNLRRDDLKFDSPYNTYVYPGLPPGPIASPGLASLRASAQPAEVPFLYFVSRNDGSHVFAKTLAEHNRNVHRWQKTYWRERWAEERRQRASRDPSH